MDNDASTGGDVDFRDAINNGADLSLTKTVDNADACVGSQVTFTLTVTNNGPVNITAGATLTDILPAGFTYVSDNGGGSYNSGTGLWTLPALTNGSNAQLQITATVNATGPYTNTATITSSPNSDPNNSNNTASISVNVGATPATPTLTSTAATCSSEEITTITNYDSALSYAFSPAGPSVTGTGEITGATAGTSYTVTASNATCTSASASFTNDAMLPTPAVPTLSTSAATCSAEGSTTITNYDSALTYTFSPAGPSVTGTGEITGATAGTNYTVTASNATCTSASASFTNDAMLPTPATPTISTSAATCSAEGSTTITNYDSALTYTFTPAGPSVGTGGLITGATAGTNYTVTASNATCTSASASFTNDAMLPTPATPSLSANGPVCSGDDAIFTISGTAGDVVTYTGAVSGNVTIGAGGTVNVTVSGITSDTTLNLTNVSNGTCDLALNMSKTVTVNPNVVASAAVTTSIACNGGTATVTITATSGTAPFTYTLDGVTNNTGVFSNIAPGTYNWSVTDTNSCGSANGTIDVTEPSVLSASGLVTDATIAGVSDGSIDLTLTGGTSPYTYSWSNGATTEDITGLAAGTYDVTVTDANSCTTTASFTVSEPGALTLTETITNLACNGDNSGAIDITVGGGVGPYTYVWNTGAATEDLSGLSAGNYSVTVTDANGATLTGNYTITEPAVLSASGTVTDATIAGVSDGS